MVMGGGRVRWQGFIFVDHFLVLYCGFSLWFRCYFSVCSAALVILPHFVCFLLFFNALKDFFVGLDGLRTDFLIFAAFSSRFG